MKEYIPKNLISYGKQWIEDDDIHAVVNALKSDYLTQGPAIANFEKAICDYTSAKYCVTFSNATASLHCAVKALDISSGMEGITSPNTFVSSSNCMVYNSIKPVFADIDPDTYNISPVEIKNKITDKTRLLIPVHFAGRPCDMEKISLMAREKSLFVIEDAAHAIGSNYPDGSKVGCCKHSDMTVFSFHPVKTMTTGEGGAVTTNSREIYEKLLLYRSHGITKNPDKLEKNDGPWYYEMQELGFNYRITDIQAALGISQLMKIETFKKRRNEIIQKYNAAFADIDWLRIPYPDSGNSCFHLYIVLINFREINRSRLDVMKELRQKNIGTQVLYIPVYTQPYYRKKFGYGYGNCPNAEEYYQKSLALPLYPKMSNNDIEYIIKTVRNMGH